MRNRTFYERRLKRAVDVTLGSALAVASLPVAAVLASAVRVGLGKPVLYEQQRIGQNGELFTIYKFRTMRPDRRRRDVDDMPVATDRRTGHKNANDPRHTGLGRRLRELSLDEIPQIINAVSYTHLTLPTKA